MRQIKDKFKIKKMKKKSKTKRRIKNRMFPILLSLLIVSITCCATTQAYFNSKISLAETFGIANKNSTLDISNGSVKLSFTDDSQWTSSTSSITKGGDGTYIFPSIGSGDEFKYGPVELKSTSSLTSNIDLGIDFDLTAEQTSNGDTGSSEVEEDQDFKKFVPGFEVIVGDMDNFGYGFAQNANINTNAFTNFDDATQLSTQNYYDVYNDWNNPTQALRQFNRAFGSINYAPASTPYSRKYNGMSIFPNSNYDAKGTDRRMVNSGFYNYMKNNGVINANNKANFSGKDYGVAFGNANASGCTFDFDSNKKPNEDKLEKKFYVDGACYYWMHFNDNDGTVRVVYDGLTERALKGYYGAWYAGTIDTEQKFINTSNNSSEVDRGNGLKYWVYWKNWIGMEQEHMADGKDWRYIQEVEPLTFKYADIPTGEEINSLCIQIYIDDIQPYHYNYDNKSSFSYVSKNTYKLQVSGAGDDDKSKWKEITAWSNVINKLSQSGPSGEMITLNMSDLNDDEKKIIIEELRKGGGLNGNGLKLKIDDDTLTRYLSSTELGKFAMAGNARVVSGDSYAIDFAKMTVNGNIDPTQDFVTITGTVTDMETNKPIAGVKVSASNAAEDTTDANGKYLLKAIRKDEVITITATHEQYKNGTQQVNFNSNKTVDFKLAKKADANKEKVDISIIIDEYAKDANNVLNNTSIDDITNEEKNNLAAKNISLTQKTEAVNVDGTQVIRTTRSYNNINLDEVKMQLAQCSVKVEPQRVYKIYYSIKLQEGASGLCTYKFNSSLKAKSTQENNPGWKISGENAGKYGSKVDILGNTITFTTSDDTGGSTGGSTGGTSQEPEITSQNILKNNKPGIYFQNSRGMNPPVINLKGNDLTTSSMPQDNGWWKANPQDIEKQSTIKVSQPYSNNTSGNLYYFNTKKVFICTE